MIYADGYSNIIILVRAVSFNIMILTNIGGVKLNDSLWPFYDPIIAKPQYSKNAQAMFTLDKLIRLSVLTLVAPIPIVDKNKSLR